MSAVSLVRHLTGFVLPVGLLGLWEILGRNGVLSDESFSRPSKIFVAVLDALKNGSLFLQTMETFSAATLAWLISAIVGIALGLILGNYPAADRLSKLSVEVFRSVPSVALIPLALLLFGFSLTMDVVVASFAALWPVLISTIHSVRGVNSRLLDVGNALGYNLLGRLFFFALPAALPFIATALRVSFGIAVVVVVTVEIVANPRGLGFAMISAQQSLQPALMYATLLWLGFVCWALNEVLLAVERRIFSWRVLGT